MYSAHKHTVCTYVRTLVPTSVWAVADQVLNQSVLIVSTYVRTYVHTYVCTYIRTYVCMYVRMYVRMLRTSNKKQQ